MTKLFRDVDFYIVHASNSTQREFELDFADIIEVYDIHETTITTECGRTLVITWEGNKYFKSYKVIYETPLMEYHPGMVEEIISMLRHIEVDGETMQYIIQKVGLEDQMLRQLLMISDLRYLNDLIEEKLSLK